MEHSVIYLHPEITVAELSNIALSMNLRLRDDRHGRFVLEPLPFVRLPNGARYVSSDRTDIRKTIERARAQQPLPDR
jgi:hypothetical protein